MRMRGSLPYFGGGRGRGRGRGGGGGGGGEAGMFSLLPDLSLTEYNFFFSCIYLALPRHLSLSLSLYIYIYIFFISFLSFGILLI